MSSIPALMRICYMLLCSMLFHFYTVAQQLPDLIPYNNNNHWGYADTNGNVIIPAQWSQASFFIGDRARVGIGESQNYSYSCIATINKAGNYIIPPSRHWSGAYIGWSSQLNSFDSTGLWGLIDTNNNLIIPYQWQAPSYSSFNMSLTDSYKVVTSGGVNGLIDRNNKLVIPCNYSSISYQSLLYDRLRAFVVADPDNTNGSNQFGVVDINGNTLIPTRYSSITYLEQGGQKGFLLKVSTVGGNGISRWLDYPSMKEGTPPVGGLDQIQKETLKYGYILSGDNNFTLMDTNRSVLIPCCSIQKINKDSIVEYNTVIKGDSMIIKESYRHTNTLQLFDSVVKFIYRQPYDRAFRHTQICGTGARMRSEQRNLMPMDIMPQLIVNGYASEYFFKDSFIYKVESLIDQDPLVPIRNSYALEQMYKDKDNLLYCIKGDVRGSHSDFDPREYTAIVDGNVNYVVPPMKALQIKSYNRKDDILIVSGRNTHYWFAGYGGLDSKGNVLFDLKDKEVVGAFRWHGKLYLYQGYNASITATGNKQLFYPRGGLRYIRVVDTAGNIAEAWRHIIAFALVPDSILAPGEKGFYVRDSTDKVSIVDPAGNRIYPHLCGKYKLLSYAGNGFFLAADTINNNKLVDINDKEVVPGLHVLGALDKNVRYAGGYQPGIEYPGLMPVYAYMHDKAEAQNFFIDNKGIAYTGIVPHTQKVKRKK